MGPIKIGDMIGGRKNWSYFSIHRMAVLTAQERLVISVIFLMYSVRQMQF
jgi:hypothetical protein